MTILITSLSIPSNASGSKYFYPRVEFQLNTANLRTSYYDFELGTCNYLVSGTMATAFRNADSIDMIYSVNDGPWIRKSCQSFRSDGSDIYWGQSTFDCYLRFSVDGFFTPVTVRFKFEYNDGNQTYVDDNNQSYYTLSNVPGYERTAIAARQPLVDLGATVIDDVLVGHCITNKDVFEEPFLFVSYEDERGYFRYARPYIQKVTSGGQVHWEWKAPTKGSKSFRYTYDIGDQYIFMKDINKRIMFSTR